MLSVAAFDVRWLKLASMETELVAISHIVGIHGVEFSIDKSCNTVGNSSSRLFYICLTFFANITKLAKV